MLGWRTWILSQYLSPLSPLSPSLPKELLIYHVLVSGGITYMVVSDDAMGRRVPFAFLEEVGTRGGDGGGVVPGGVSVSRRWPAGSEFWQSRGLPSLLLHPCAGVRAAYAMVYPPPPPSPPPPCR